MPRQLAQVHKKTIKISHPSTLQLPTTQRGQAGNALNQNAYATGHDLRNATPQLSRNAQRIRFINDRAINPAVFRSLMSISEQNLHFKLSQSDDKRSAGGFLTTLLCPKSKGGNVVTRPRPNLPN